MTSKPNMSGVKATESNRENFSKDVHEVAQVAEQLDADMVQLINWSLGGGDSTATQTEFLIEMSNRLRRQRMLLARLAQWSGCIS